MLLQGKGTLHAGYQRGTSSRLQGMASCFEVHQADQAHPHTSWGGLNKANSRLDPHATSTASKAND